MKRIFFAVAVFLLAMGLAACTQGQGHGQGELKAAVAKPGEGPVMDPPTLQCLGAYWLVKDTDEKPATITSEYRKAGTKEWMPGAPFIRCRKGPFKDEHGKMKMPLVEIPEGYRMFAGSIFVLEPDTAYEWQLTLHNADGTEEGEILKGHTIAEPVVSAKARRRHVIIDVLGNGGPDGIVKQLEDDAKLRELAKNKATLEEELLTTESGKYTPEQLDQMKAGVTKVLEEIKQRRDELQAVAREKMKHVGTAANPFRGLAAADWAAVPGDVFLVHAGTYPAFVVHTSGEPGKPIVWQGAGDGDVVIDAKDMKEIPLQAKAPDNPRAIAIDAQNLHDVSFQKLTACNGRVGIAIHGSSNVVIQRCRIHHCVEGIYCTVNRSASVHGFFISDNLLEGMYKWPATSEEWHTRPESRGIWITGRGHVACYNRISHWKDGMDTEDSPETVSVDFHNNDITESFDDPVEMDGSDRNCRCFNNRFCNSLTGVSLQPVNGGPVYVFRNVAYNVLGEPFKLHNDPSGGVIFHNTLIKPGQPVYVSSADFVHNCIERNNLFVGTDGRAFNYDVNTVDCDFDYDGVAGWNGPVFMKWNKVMYKTPEEAKEKCPVEKHGVVLDPAKIFASGLKAPENRTTVFDQTKNDFRLSADSEAKGKGEALPWANEGRTTPADLGAVPFGGKEPHYGIRPEGAAR